MKIRTLLIPLVVLTACGTMVEAQTLRERLRERSQDKGPVDANADGTVTLEESAHRFKENKEDRVKLFTTLDANRDGRIAAAEYPNQGPFKKADLDSDGFLTTNEFLLAYGKGTAKKLDQADRNDDAVLSAEEIEKAAEEGRKRRLKRRENR